MKFQLVTSFLSLTQVRTDRVELIFIFIFIFIFIVIVIFGVRLGITDDAATDKAGVSPTRTVPLQRR